MQHKCDTGQATCRTRLRTRINISIKRPSNRVTLPATWGTIDAPEAALQGFKPTELLIANTVLPPLDSMEVRHLLVYRKNFALDARFTLDIPKTSDGINPDKEEVHLDIGGKYQLRIPPGKFKRSLQGRLFTFIGQWDGVDIAATFTRGTNPVDHGR